MKLITITLGQQGEIIDICVIRQSSWVLVVKQDWLETDLTVAGNQKPPQEWYEEITVENQH